MEVLKLQVKDALGLMGPPRGSQCWLRRGSDV